MREELRFKNFLDDEAEEFDIVIEGERVLERDADGRMLRKEPAEERFTCLPEQPAKATDLLTKGTTTIEFVVACLVPGQELRFRGLIEDKDFLVRPQTARDVYNGLLERYSGGRPTTAPSASGSGREPSGDSSESGSGEPGS